MASAAGLGTLSTRKAKVTHAAAAPVLAEWEDLERAGCPKSAFYEKLSEIYCAPVDSIDMNEGLCLDHSHYSYIVRDYISNSNRQWSTVMATGDSREVANNTEEPITFNVLLKSTQTTSATATVTKACDFTLRKGIIVDTNELGIQAMPRTLLQLENSVGHASTKSEGVEIVRSVDVALQPGQKAVAYLDLSWTELKQDFEIPFALDGWCMSTLGHSVNGQRNWLHDIASLFQTPKSIMRGAFECVYDIQGSALVSLV